MNDKKCDKCGFHMTIYEDGSKECGCTKPMKSKELEPNGFAFHDKTLEDKVSDLVRKTFGGSVYYNNFVPELMKILNTRVNPEQGLVLSLITEALGWQGGTIHDVILEIKKLKVMESRSQTITAKEVRLPKMLAHKGNCNLINNKSIKCDCGTWDYNQALSDVRKLNNLKEEVE